ncbi:sensor histidine kinase [Deinococcus ruber]|uniref:histidine kinase n=1 Tax=Deinococcus ruber TaxID=1848197 RepID=A0A918C4D3_9DEIO|nr:HAMP domain-containing sensor histidine kinase [Deinococcus ruber]GGR05136.1 two-component sensor histidine kinase [Deinococcus ruber]
MKEHPQRQVDDARRKPSSQTRYRGGWNTLRFQFTLVIFLLAFLPNAVLTIVSGQRGDLIGIAGLSLALWLSAVAILSALIGWILSGALLRPLSRLTGELGSGEMQIQNGHGLNDDPREVRALRGAFGGLLSRLLTEQERRSAFMATLVHDLKTPLIATGHLIHALSDRSLPEGEREMFSQHLLAENARLLGLVQQMADAHRFERDEVRLTLLPTDLRALLDTAAIRERNRATVKGVALTVSGNGQAEVDPAVLERAIGNLIDNALRYAHSSIELRVTSTGLQVRDDGPGLPEQMTLHSLAQPFNAQPVEIAGQRYTAGTAGLGLYIVRRIVEAHGGELRYSRDIGQGGLQQTVMELVLPADFQPSDLTPASLDSVSAPFDEPLNPDSSIPQQVLPSSSVLVPFFSTPQFAASQEVHP